MPLDDTSAGAVCAAAGRLRHLPPGPLAELRRMSEETAAPEFWRLAACYPGTIGNPRRYGEWIAIVRILSLLTQKGDSAGRHPLHNPRRRLGAVLCDGGDPDWPPMTGGSPRPAFSERRLAQLMAARGPQRAVLLERAARALAGSRDPRIGVNVVDIADTLLKPHDQRRLAEPYYGRLERADYSAHRTEQGSQ